jgi:hypothetical protein
MRGVDGQRGGREDREVETYRGIAGMVLMKRNKVYKGLMGAFGACLLLAGCSSSQKQAALTPVGGSATGASSSAVSATPTSGASTSPSSAAGSSSAAAAPTTVSTSSGGWTFKATVPGDANSLAAMAAFEKYNQILLQMTAKADYSKNLSDYADGTPLTLANNFVLSLKRSNDIMVGPSIQTVTSTALNMAASPLPLMTISVCIDDTKQNEVASYGPKKGQVLVSPYPHPYPATFTVHKSADGKWRVTSVHAESDKTC